MASQEAEDGTLARRCDEVHDARPRSSSALSGGGDEMAPRLRRVSTVTTVGGYHNYRPATPEASEASPDISEVVLYDRRGRRDLEGAQALTSISQAVM